MPVHPVKRRDFIIAGLILLLAAFMRLERIGISEFRFDEALLSTLAQDWLAGGALPTRGLIASVGLPQGPWMVYVLAIPYAIVSDPLFATAFVALLNIIGVGLLWWFTHRYFSPTAAVFAGMVYAVSPIAVLFSRKIWNPNMHTPFLLAGVLLACYGFLEKKWWAQALCLPFFLLPMQFHYQGGLMIPVLLVFLWMGRKNIRWSAVAVGAALTLLTLLPLLSSITGKDVELAQQVFGRGGGGVAFTDRAAGYFVRFIAGAAVENAIVTPEQGAEIIEQIAPPVMLWYTLLVFFAAGCIAVWWRYRRFGVALYLWAFLTPLALTPTWINAYEHYFVLSLPVIFLLTGIGAESLIRVLARFTGKFSLPYALVAAIFALIVGTQAVWWRALTTYLDTYATPLGMNAPLHFLMDVREKISGYEDVLVIGGNATYSSSNIWLPLVRHHTGCVRDVLVDGGSIAVFPARPFAVLIPPNPAPYSQIALYQSADKITVPLREGEGEYTIYRFEQQPTWTETPITSVDAPLFENGVRLTGYHLTENTLYLRWHLENPDKQTQYQYYAHFLDAAGERIGQRDTAFYNAGYRCDGDTLITWVDTPVPPETVTLRAGMYTLVDGRASNVRWLDEAGNPVGTGIDIPLE